MTLESLPDGDNSNAQPRAPVVERIDRVCTPAPGQYWRVTQAHGDGGSLSIPADEVLLVSDVKITGHTEHSVHVLCHPRDGTATTYRYLYAEFLLKFEHAPDGAGVRARELADLQGELQITQALLVQGAQDPDIIRRAYQQSLRDESGDAGEKTGLPATAADVTAINVMAAQMPTLEQALSTGVAELQASALQALGEASKVATYQAQWIEARATHVARLTKAMTPYYIEQASVAQARVKGAVDTAKGLLSAVATLDLFTGKGVDCEMIIDGPPAPAGERPAFFQKRVFLDEEEMFYRHFVEPESRRFYGELVAKLACTPALQDQIIPSPRGAVLCGLSRRQVNYGDEAQQLLAAIRVEKNRRASFLLIRDGARWFTLHSNLLREDACRLFPAETPDKDIFRHLDGSRVTISDLDYPDCLDNLRREATHFRRMIVAIAGQMADGKFWEGQDPMDLFRAARSSRYRFVADDSGEGMLGQQLPSASQYLRDTRKALRHGSTVALDLPELLRPAVIPGAFAASSYGSDVDPMATPISKFALSPVKVVAGVAQAVAPFRINRTQREISATVLLRASELRSSRAAVTVVNAVDPHLLRRIFATRAGREEAVDYAEFLVRLMDAAEQRRHALGVTESQLAAELNDAGIGDEDSRLAAARAAIGVLAGAIGEATPLKQEQRAGLRQLAFRIHAAQSGRADIDDARSLASGAALDVLRVTLDALGRRVLWCTDPNPDNFLLPQREVLAITVTETRKGAALGSRRLEMLRERDPAHYTLWQKDNLAPERFGDDGAVTVDRKRSILADIERRATEFLDLTHGRLAEGEINALTLAFCEQHRKANLDRGSVQVPVIEIPVGLVASETRLNVLVIRGDLYQLAGRLPAGAFSVFSDRVSRIYENRGAAERKLASARALASHFQLRRVSAKEWVRGRRNEVPTALEGGNVYLDQEPCWSAPRAIDWVEALIGRRPGRKARLTSQGAAVTGAKLADAIETRLLAGETLWQALGLPTPEVSE